VSHRHDDADPVEHDPTGMRALLGSLPDPGPMPEHLVARITAALEEESRGVRGATGAPSPTWVPPVAPEPVSGTYLAGPEDDGVVVPLRRRRTWLLGAAAAAVVVIGAGGVVVDRLADGGLVASLGVSQGGNDSAADSAAGGAAPESGAVAEDPTLGVVVVATGTDYAAAELGRLAAGLPGAPEAGDESALRSDLSVSEPLAGPAGARSCASGLGVDPDDEVTLDLATVDGRRAAVVVATAADGTARAWAVERSCTASAPGVIAGPVAVG
jgi:hypothetical protein